MTIDGVRRDNPIKETKKIRGHQGRQTGRQKGRHRLTKENEKVPHLFPFYRCKFPVFWHSSIYTYERLHDRISKRGQDNVELSVSKIKYW